MLWIKVTVDALYDYYNSSELSSDEDSKKIEGIADKSNRDRETIDRDSDAPLDDSSVNNDTNNEEDSSELSFESNEGYYLRRTLVNLNNFI